VIKPANRRRHDATAAALAVLMIALAVTCTITSLRWIGRTFPGFFVMANGVVASVSLPDWPAAKHDVYQHAVMAVNGVPTNTGHEVYAIVGRLPSGAKITYMLRQGDRQSELAVNSRTFTDQDYLLIFLPYLLSGLGLALIGIAVWWLAPEAAGGRALLIGGIAGGVFAITAADLYSPANFFRLHILGEAFFPAGLLIHLALVFPVDRLRRWRGWLLALPYMIAAALGASYEFYLYRPAAYTLIHNLCMIYAGLGGIFLLGAVAWDYCTSPSFRVRQRLRIILLGLLAGFTFPGALMLYSGLAGGAVPVNYAGYTVVIFPLSVGYAIIKHDLFEIDALIKRGVYYLALTATLMLGYLAMLALLDLDLNAAHLAPTLPASLAFISILALLLNPLRNLLQKSIDRIFFRLHYDPRRMLEASSAALGSTLRLNEILAFVHETIGATVAARDCRIFLQQPAHGRYLCVYPPMDHPPTLAADDPLVERLKSYHQGVFTTEDGEEPSFAPARMARAHESEVAQQTMLAAPLMLKHELLGMILLGRKESGAFFSADDRAFLGALANQSVLSIGNAMAYAEIEALNLALEARVEERTRELARSNADLRSSIERLGHAYSDLQRSRQTLTRAESMAALGRLSAGIAHEMNTPLGASMTSLKLIQQLVEELPRPAPTGNAPHNGAAVQQIMMLVSNTRQWIDKAAAHIRSLKAHTRDLEQEESRTFSVRELLEQIEPLVAHRLRLADCTLKVTSGPDPLVFGDAGKLSQVLTNLIVNAIDAYTTSLLEERTVGVDIRSDQSAVVITVSDHGCGISPANLDKIFDQFFSTKPLGEGTGLGLSISRDIVTALFGGTISVESAVDQGSRFIVYIPAASPRDNPAAPRKPGVRS